jgi:hypothetical protein
MKKRLAMWMFAYGCLGSMAATIWLSLALAPIELHRPPLWLIESLFMVHGCALVLTFHRNPGTVIWRPVLRVTSKRLKAAQLVLMLSAANVLAWLTSVFVLASQNNRQWAEWALSPFLASCSLLSTIYLALHWGYRPENLFPTWLLSFAANPIGPIVRRLVR